MADRQSWLAKAFLALGMLASFIGFFNTYPEVGSFLWSGLVWCWDWLRAWHALPGWSLLILCASSLFLVIGIVSSYRQNKKPPSEPWYYSFTHFTLDGMVWRWEWGEQGSFYSGQVIGLTCFCPSCDMELQHKNKLNGREVRFMCERCNKIVQDIQEYDRREYFELVEKEIQRQRRAKEAPAKTTATH